MVEKVGLWREMYQGYFIFQTDGSNNLSKLQGLDPKKMHWKALHTEKSVRKHKNATFYAETINELRGLIDVTL